MRTLARLVTSVLVVSLEEGEGVSSNFFSFFLPSSLSEILSPLPSIRLVDSSPVYEQNEIRFVGNGCLSADLSRFLSMTSPSFRALAEFERFQWKLPDFRISADRLELFFELQWHLARQNVLTRKRSNSLKSIAELGSLFWRCYLVNGHGINEEADLPSFSTVLTVVALWGGFGCSLVNTPAAFCVSQMDPLRSIPVERDVEQVVESYRKQRRVPFGLEISKADSTCPMAITALKKGAYLLKYGRRGKPKFCPFRLSNKNKNALTTREKKVAKSMLTKKAFMEKMAGEEGYNNIVVISHAARIFADDESLLIWYSGKHEKQLKLSAVTKIIPGQRTAIFQRYPRPEKEYQSFSLIYNDRSLDLMCKDKDEAEVWFVALKALTSQGNYRKWKIGLTGDRTPTDTNNLSILPQRISPWISPNDISDILHKDRGVVEQSGRSEIPRKPSLTKAISDAILRAAIAKGSNHSDLVGSARNSCSSAAGDILSGRCSAADNVRVSLSSAVSSSSQGSYHDDFDALGDVFIWGKGIGDGVLGGGMLGDGNSSSVKMDALLPKALESAVMLDVHDIACGDRHAVLVTKQGEVFSWGEESGGRLGHGVEVDVSNPKHVNTLSGLNIEVVACGEHHTCAVTLSGDLYTWGESACASGVLGHGTDASHWIPKKVTGQMEGMHVSSIACGPWHTAVLTLAGQLFTFGDGTFGALGHGDRKSVSMPREVESLKGLRTVRVACGVWHTAAVVEIMDGTSRSNDIPSGKLFTWGDGDKAQLGHGDNDPRLVPACVAALVETSFCRVACGHQITVALSTTGQVYVMGSAEYGQLGIPKADGKVPSCIEGKISQNIVEEVACGSYHVAILTARNEVYTWGKGSNGRLGHGDNDDRNAPTLVEALKDKQVKSVVCGSNFTAAICLHKWASGVDHSICTGCRNAFGFRRKRHNCYNCGLVFCKACSSRKSARASLAPNINKPYRVCDDCYTKLKKVIEAGSSSRSAKNQIGSVSLGSNEVGEREILDSRLPGHQSRLSSAESFKQNDGRNPKPNRRTESREKWSSPSLRGSSKWGRLSRSLDKAVPRLGSRATSPTLLPPPTSSTTLTFFGLPFTDSPTNTLEQTNDNSSEVVKLRVLVEELTKKSQTLESELERTLKQLKEATEIAREETAKCKAAKDMVRSLTGQLKDIVARVPEGTHNVNFQNSDGDEQAGNLKASHETDSNGHVSNPGPSNGTNTQAEEVQWVEQDEAGVYITLSHLPGGGQELKRVRFSKKKFSGKQAEIWWIENKARIYKKYNILTAGKPSASGARSSRKHRKTACEMLAIVFSQDMIQIACFCEWVFHFQLVACGGEDYSNRPKKLSGQIRQMEKGPATNN
ncbi:hypothetical protein ACLOJK_013042 [Asimina triloba]